jgi:hypothetical protein
MDENHPIDLGIQMQMIPRRTHLKAEIEILRNGMLPNKGSRLLQNLCSIINWQTIRIMLVMSLLLGLATKQVDYTVRHLSTSTSTEIPTGTT